MKKVLIRGVSLLLALVMAMSIAVLFTGCMDEDCLGHYNWSIIIHWNDDYVDHGYYLYIYDLFIYHRDNKYELNFVGDKIDKIDYSDIKSYDTEVKKLDFLPDDEVNFTKTYSESKFENIDTGTCIEFKSGLLSSNKYKVTLDSGNMAAKGSKAILDYYTNKEYEFSGAPYYSRFISNSNYAG